jgi:hypothetical protein
VGKKYEKGERKKEKKKENRNNKTIFLPLSVSGLPI